MGRLKFNGLLIGLILMLNLQVKGFGDDEKKTSKKTGFGTIIKKIKLSNNQKDKEDTLVYDKQREDTLTYDDGTTADDTLIFADDEMNLQISPKSKKPSDQTFLINSSSAHKFNSHLYPNPSLGNTSLELYENKSEISEITITAQDGSLVKHEFIIGSKIELTGLASGNYWINIKNGSELQQKRLFVK